MPRINQIALAVPVIFLLMVSTQAQTPHVSTVNVKAEADRVHISTEGYIAEMRIDVVSEAGDVVFESGAITGNELDWNMRDTQGERVSAGTYLVTVTFRTAAGKLRKRVEQVTVSEDEKASAQTSATSTPNAAQATITGSGAIGKIAKFTGAAVIGNSVITESANKIGIGTTAPTSTLHVNSTAGNSPAILAANNAAGGIAIKGGSANVTGIGVWGIHTATTGTTPGVKGETNSTVPNAVGVLGVINSTNSGDGSAAVRGTNKGTGYGVFGETANGTGVFGTAPHGIGVLGISGTFRGVYGISTSSTGVFGESSTATGVIGNSGSGNGVQGDSNSGTGVIGVSSSGNGVLGESTNATGVGGTGGSNGVSGVSTGGITTAGVRGRSTNGVGVHGSSTNNDGVVGVSNSNSHSGVAGSNTGSGNGVYGESLGGGFAGYFAGDVRVIGTINPTSDRAAKAVFQIVDGRQILQRLVELPIKSWSYKSDRFAARHIGPTSQDFAATFRFGRDDKSIATVDADGVALAAIQGLYQMMQEKDRRIEQLQSRLAKLERTLKQRNRK